MKTRDLALIALFAALTAIGAWISIPIQAVPFTFQVFFVLLAGAVLGTLRGGFSQIVYALMGAIGVPVFAGFTAGLGVLLGPTGGYIYGFIAAAFVIGALTAGSKSYWRDLGSMLVGVAVIYALGLAQLVVVTKMSVAQAFIVGAAQFIPFDVFKAVIAAGLAGRLRTVLSEVNRP